MKSICVWGCILSTAFLLPAAGQGMIITQQFTSAEGFVAGDIGGQQGWMQSHAAGLTVDPTGDGSLLLSSAWRQAWHADGPFTLGVGESITLSAELSLDGDDKNLEPDGNFIIARMGVYRWDDAAETWDHANLTSMSRIGTNMNLRTGGNLTPDTSLGAYTNHFDSLLRIELSITAAATAGDTSIEYRLHDLTKGNTSSWSGYDGISEELHTALLNDGVYPSVGTGPFSSQDSGITGVRYHSATIIPEPASALLIGLGLAGIFAFRRYRSLPM